MVLIFAVFLALAMLAFGQSPPDCLISCLDAASNSTEPICTNALPDLIACLNTRCPTTSSRIPTTRYRMTYSPKALYSCQMNNIPGPSTDIDPTTLTLNGDGECASSPYRFGSFIPASESMQAMNGVCTMMLYPQAECGGVATRVPMGSMQDETCVFRGGRSARLACAGSANEAALSYLSSYCGNASLPTEPGPVLPASTVSGLGSSSTSPSASAETSTADVVIPYISANGTVYATILPQSPTSNSTYATEGAAVFEGLGIEVETSGGLLAAAVLVALVVLV